MTTSIVTAPMQAKAAKIADLLPLFSRGTSKVTGQPFYVVPASNRLTAHWTAVDGSGCTCLGYQRRGTCTHDIAAKTVHDRQQPAPAPKPRAGYRDVFGVCDVLSCDEDRETGERFCVRHALTDAF